MYHFISFKFVVWEGGTTESNAGLRIVANKKCPSRGIPYQSSLKIKLSLIKQTLITQAQFFVLHHFAQIVKGVAHAAKGSVNAYLGNVGYFFKA